MTFETKAIMRSGCFIGLVVVLAGITAGTAPATSTTRTAMPGRNGRIVFVDGLESGNLASCQCGRHGPGPADVRPGRRAGVLARRQADRVLQPAPRRPRHLPAGARRQQPASDHLLAWPMTATRAWSPDGARLAFETTRNGGQTDIYSVGADGTGSAKLAGTPRTSSIRAWSPSGTKIAYTVEDGRQRQIWVMNADGSGQTQLTKHPELQREPELVAGRAADRLRFRPRRAGQPRHLLDERGRLRRAAAHRQPGTRRRSRLLAERRFDRVLE